MIQSLDAVFHKVQCFQEDNCIHQDQLLEVILSSADLLSALNECSVQLKEFDADTDTNPQMNSTRTAVGRRSG